MPMPKRGRLGLQVGALVGREVGEDEAGDAGLAEAPQDAGPVAAPEHLVDVAHGHQRGLGPGGVDATDELDGVVQARPVSQGDRAGALQRGAIGQRVRVGQADLQEVGAGVDLGERDGQRGLGIGIAGDRVRDERGTSRPGGSVEGRGDAGGADGSVGAEGGGTGGSRGAEREPSGAGGSRGRPGRSRGRPGRSRPRTRAHASPRDRHAGHEALLDGREVLVPATGQPQQDDVVRPGGLDAPAGEQVDHGVDGVRRLERREDALGARQQADPLERLLVGRAQVSRVDRRRTGPRAGARCRDSRARPRSSGPRSPGRPRPGGGRSASRAARPACRRPGPPRGDPPAPPPPPPRRSAGCPAHR